jgi:hypothetical protein
MEKFVFEELAGDALREVLRAVKGTFLCRSTAERLRRSVEPLLPLVQGGGRGAGEIRELAARVREALELARCAAASPRWNVYRAAQLARRMEAADRGIERWLRRHAPAHVIGAVRRLRDDADARIGRLERRVEEIAAVPVAVPMEGIPHSKAMEMTPHKAMTMPPMEMTPHKHKGMEEVMSMDVQPEGEGMVGAAVKLAKEKVKEMVMSGTGGWEVVGISGMGGSGKTTLATEIFRDQKVQGTKQAPNLPVTNHFFPLHFLQSRVPKPRLFVNRRVQSSEIILVFGLRACARAV